MNDKIETLKTFFWLIRWTIILSMIMAAFFAVISLLSKRIAEEIFWSCCTSFSGGFIGGLFGIMLGFLVSAIAIKKTPVKTCLFISGNAIEQVKKFAIIFFLFGQLVLLSAQL